MRELVARQALSRQQGPQVNTDTADILQWSIETMFNVFRD